MGTIQLSLDQMLRVDADEKGYKRLGGDVLSAKKEVMGRIKIAYKIEVERRPHPTSTPSGVTSSYNGQPGNNNPMGLGLGANSMAWDNQSYISHDMILQQQSRLNGGQQSSYQQSSYRDDTVLLPCSLTLHTVIAMELTQISRIKRNQPIVKVFCDNFYQLSEVCYYCYSMC